LKSYSQTHAAVSPVPPLQLRRSPSHQQHHAFPCIPLWA
jgi:hypothetical protein